MTDSTTQGREAALQRLRRELAAPPSTSEELIDLAAAVAQVEDTGADERLATTGRDALQSAPPELRANALDGLAERVLADELAQIIEEASDPSEVTEWLLATDRLARAARVLNRVDIVRAAFDALADDIQTFPPVYAPWSDFAEQQEALGLGANMKRPLLRFWSELSMADVRVDLLARTSPPADESSVQTVLSSLFATEQLQPRVVVDLVTIRRRRDALRQDATGHRLAAHDSVPDLEALPMMERIGGAGEWEAFVQAEETGVLLAVYGLGPDARLELTGPTGQVLLTWSDDRWLAPLDEAGSWTLRTGGDAFPFTLSDGP